MENYTKSEVKELEDPYPFSIDDTFQMRISQGSRIRNVMGFAMKKMAEKDVRQIAWNGSGPNVTKTITCAEIMKRKFKSLHQITKIRFKRIEEHWLPNVDGLEPLKVKRDIPAISILLSKDPLDANESGYQPPGNFETFWQEKTDKAGRSGSGRGRQRSSSELDSASQDHKSAFKHRKRNNKHKFQQQQAATESRQNEKEKSKTEKSEVSGTET